MRAWIGVDPGASGCMVAIIEDGDIKVCRFEKSTETEMWDFINGLAFDYDCFCTLELVGAMPGQGVSSMFQFGDGVGFIRGLLTAARIPFEKKVPRTWQKAFAIPPRETGKNGGVEESKVEFKRRVKQVAERLFPKMKITNDIADALLIAEFTRRTHV